MKRFEVLYLRNPRCRKLQSFFATGATALEAAQKLVHIVATALVFNVKDENGVFMFSGGVR